MSPDNINKQHLYESVKSLIENNSPHIHLCQHKLFTLFSIGFQYLLFMSTKKPGHFIIRIEDSHLANKLCRKAKDEISRKFLTKLLIPRKLTYGKSTFFLDYFNMGTWWPITNFPQEKIRGALIVKNTSSRPLNNNQYTDQLYLSSLIEFVPKTITIAFEEHYDQLMPHQFDFIKEGTTHMAPLSGVHIAKDLTIF